MLTFWRQFFFVWWIERLLLQIQCRRLQSSSALFLGCFVFSSSTRKILFNYYNWHDQTNKQTNKHYRYMLCWWRLFLQSVCKTPKHLPRFFFLFFSSFPFLPDCFVIAFHTFRSVWLVCVCVCWLGGLSWKSSSRFVVLDDGWFYSHTPPSSTFWACCLSCLCLFFSFFSSSPRCKTFSTSLDRTTSTQMSVLLVAAHVFPLQAESCPIGHQTHANWHQKKKTKAIKVAPAVVVAFGEWCEWHTTTHKQSTWSILLPLLLWC